MADIRNFDTVQEFKQFVAHLSNEDIKQFSYQDWNNLYGKLDAMLEKRNFHKAWEKYMQEMPFPEEGSYEEYVMQSADSFLTNVLCADEFIKLYQNFHLTEQDCALTFMRAEEAAQTLVNLDFNTAKLAHAADDGYRQKCAEAVDHAVFKASRYAEKAKLNSDGCKRMRSEITFADNMELAGEASGADTHTKIRLNREAIISSGAFVGFMAHETFHAHFQTATRLQKDLYHNSGILPEGITTELADLFHNNDAYYLLCETICQRYPDDRQKYKGYSRQPREYHAFLFEAAMESAFRHKSKQYFENIVLETDMFLKNIYDINLLGATRCNNDIRLVYPRDDYDDIKDAFQGFQGNGVKLRRRGSYALLDIAAQFSTKQQLQSYYRQELYLMIERQKQQIAKLNKQPLSLWAEASIQQKER